MSESIATDETQNCIKAAAYTIYKFRQNIQNSVLNLFPKYAEPEFLEIIGRDRNCPRYQGESTEEYRLRVQDAFEFNRGIGRAIDIVRAIEGLGYTFGSYTAGYTGGGVGSFNLLVHSIGGKVLDGTWDLDGLTYLNSANPNDINIEIVRAEEITPEERQAIIDFVTPIIRASSSVLSIIAIAP
jgi:hypothetical protein